jgi:hypothetical protein
MGIEVGLDLAGAAQALLSAIQLIGGGLTEGRSVVIEIDNLTDTLLAKILDHHESGGFASFPEPQIPPHTADVFGSQSKGGAIATGTVGSVTYAADGLEMLIGWNNPFSGDNKTNVGANNSGLSGANATRFLCRHQTGVGNQQAHMKFELVVHPPYSLKDTFKDRGDLSQGIFKILGVQPGNGIRGQLPNTTAIDVT